MTPRILALVLIAAAAVLAVPGTDAAGRKTFKGFALTLDDVRLMAAQMPEKVRAAIAASPQDFLDRVARVLDEPAELLVLVDKKHALDKDAEPPDLVLLKDYGFDVGSAGLRVRKAIIPALRAMAQAARKEGITLLCSSAYRSYEYQVGVFDREVKQYGEAAAERESARPGMSQHQLGTVIDFGSITDAFAETRAGRWLKSNAETYGFSLSFPDGYESVTGYRWESWHYRYITPAGTDLQRRYFSDVQQYMIEFLAANRERLQAARAE